MSDRGRLTALLTAVAAVALVGTIRTAVAQTSPTGLGRAATPADIAAWGSIVGPGGEGLPAGRSTAAEGKAIYDRHCARCHGPTGQEGPDDRLVGGQGTLASGQPRMTVGSYWPHATTLWDYVNRAMPFDRPGLLTATEVYGVVAYVLYLNKLVEERQPIDAATLPAIAMPNRNGFVADPRPDVATSPTRRQP